MAAISKENRKQIIALVRAGKSPNDVAKELGLSRPAVYYWAKRAKITRDRPSWKDRFNELSAAHDKLRKEHMELLDEVTKPGKKLQGATKAAGNAEDRLIRQFALFSKFLTASGESL